MGGGVGDGGGGGGLSYLSRGWLGFLVERHIGRSESGIIWTYFVAYFL